MVTTSVYLDKRYRKNDGKFPLKIAITMHGRAAYIPLGMSLDAAHWDARRQRVTTLENRAALNRSIERQRLAVEDALLDLQAKGLLKFATATDARRMVLERFNPEDKAIYFLNWFDNYMSRKQGRTKELYSVTRNKITAFDSSRLRFEDITLAWLQRFANWMQEQGAATNTAAIDLRNIRAVFNDALDNEVTACYPFRKFKIKQTATAKRNLSVERLRMLFSYDGVGLRQCRALDLFRLSFLLVGMNIADLATLRPEDYKDGRIIYTRHKTHKEYNIKVEKEAADIISRHRSSSPLRLLDFLDTFASVHNLCSSVNIELKKLPNMQGVSTYWARHTWATIATELDIPKETIAAALGHGNTSVTDIYINFPRKKIDRANRRVIDYVMDK